jgi:ABC-type branched-subunit amino acid transport system substrate-binding protein
MFKSYRLLLVLIVLSLLILLVPACGGGKSSSLQTPTTTGAIGTLTPTATLTETPTPTVTATVTPIPTTSEPVKLGVINAWSGPLAVSGNLADQCIAVIEQQVKDMGGILGGRQVQFVRADDSGVLAQSVAQVSKLALEKNVDMILFGGESGASMNAVGQEADKLKVPFIAPSMNYGKPLLPYNVSMTSADAWIGRTVNFPIEFVKPKTIAWLAYDDKNIRDQLDGVLGVVGARERWKAAGLDLIYEQYFPQDAMDFSPYLTKIKYLNPDLVIIATNNLGQAITINKQIIELGGWGNMKVWYSTEAASGQKAVSMPGELGAYVSVLWMPGSDDPGMKTFEDAYKKTWGREPSADLAYYHVCFWAAIKAIEMAGTTERDKVAQAMRSGNFEFDSAWGHMRIAPDGYANFNMPVAQVQEGGKLVKVWPLN